MKNPLCAVFGHKPINLSGGMNRREVICCARCDLVLYAHPTVSKEAYPLAKWPAVETVKINTTRAAAEHAFAAATLGSSVEPVK